MSEQEALSLVFVHGFQGDHTSFQSFPTDLHMHLIERIPTVQTYVYPTYKSRRALEVATGDFLQWMRTLPRGPVILLGHSMGGLLIAEAAFNPRADDRVIGVVAFDVPFLGIHPHVVISGLASLFKEKGDKSEHELNDMNRVNMVNKRDGRPGISPSPSVESFQSPAAANDFDKSSNAFASSSSSSGGGGLSPSSTISRHDSLHLAVPTKTSHPVPPAVSAAFQFFGLGEPSEDFENKFHWLSKHSATPFTALKTRIWETFEFGGCLLDPIGLNTRYQNLAKWGRKDGKGWVNYWTETVPKIPPPKKEVEEGEEGAKEEHGSDDEGYHTADEGDIGGEAQQESGALAQLMQSTSEAGASAETLSTVKSQTTEGETISSPTEEEVKPVESHESQTSAEPPAEAETKKEDPEESAKPEKDKSNKDDPEERAEPRDEKAAPPDDEGQHGGSRPEHPPEPEDKLSEEPSKPPEEEASTSPPEEGDPPATAPEEPAEPLTKEEQKARDKAEKQARKERAEAEKRAKKEKEQAERERVKAEKEREKAEKQAQREREKAEREEKKAREREEKEREKAEQAAKKAKEKAEREEKKAQEKAEREAARRKKEEETPRAPHHFIVLPLGGRVKEWVRVPVEGVADEVEAHCGLFFREQNFAYDQLVEDVGDLVYGWWERGDRTMHSGEVAHALHHSTSTVLHVAD